MNANRTGAIERIGTSPKYILGILPRLARALWNTGCAVLYFVKCLTTIRHSGEVMTRLLGNRKSIVGSLILLFALSACNQGPVKVVVGDKATDEIAIRHVLDEVANTFNAGNYDSMFALYRDDVIVSGPGAPDIVGKDAWREELKSLPPGLTLKMRFDTSELEIDGNLAYERGTYLIEAKDPASGEFGKLLEGRHIHIFRREADGSWKGWRLMENSADPRTSPLSLPPATN